MGLGAIEGQSMDTSKWEVGGSREASTKRLNLSWWGLILQHLLDVRLDSHKTNREQFAPENRPKLSQKRTCIIWTNHWFSGLNSFLVSGKCHLLVPISVVLFPLLSFIIGFHPWNLNRNHLELFLEEAAGGIPFLYTASQLANLETEKNSFDVKIQIGQWKKNTLAV